MKLTSSLFGAYLKCPTKCFLWSRGEIGTEDVYGHWARTQDELYRREAARHVRMECPDSELLIDLIGAELLKTAHWRWALDFTAETKHGSFSVQALRRAASSAEGISVEFIPVHFVFRNKPTRRDEMLLTFDGLLLSEVLGCDVRHGEIVSGNQYRMRQVKTSARAPEVRDLAEKMIASLKMDSPPDLVLNRHCPESEFKHRCRERAIQSDDLSLLSAMTEKERTGLRDKGIFTVTQLSYTFRPRKAQKRAKNPANPPRLLIDLKFSKRGMRKSVTRFLCWQYKCQKCGCEFSSRDQMPDLQAYGHGLVSWWDVLQLCSQAKGRGR